MCFGARSLREEIKMSRLMSKTWHPITSHRKSYVGSLRMPQFVDRHGGFSMECFMPNDSARKYVFGDPEEYLPGTFLDVGLNEVKAGMYAAVGLTYLWDGTFTDDCQQLKIPCASGALALIDLRLLSDEKRNLAHRRKCIVSDNVSRLICFHWDDGVFNVNTALFVDTRMSLSSIVYEEPQAATIPMPSACCLIESEMSLSGGAPQLPAAVTAAVF